MELVKQVIKLYSNYSYLLDENKDFLSYVGQDGIIEHLGRGKEFSQDTQLKMSSIENKELNLKKANRPLAVGVVGGFNTGKSSFINSLIGEDLLGVKIIPATAKVTRLIYGDLYTFKKRLSTGYVENISQEEYSLVANHQYSDVKLKDNDDIEEFIITIPSPILTQINILDTPGFSSTSKKDDELTKEKVKEVDVLIWLFNANKVVDGEEVKLLKQYEGKNIIAIINQIDSKGPSVRQKIKDEVEKVFDFKDVLFYSATKIGERNKALKEQDVFMKDVFDQINELTNSDKKFQLIKEGGLLKFETEDEDRFEKELKTVEDDCFYKYYLEVNDQIKKLKVEALQLQEAKLNQEKCNIYRESREFLRDVLETDCEINNRLGQTDKNLIEAQIMCREDLKEGIFKEYNDFYPNFFSWLYKQVFYEGKQTGLFSDGHYMKLKLTDAIDKDSSLAKDIYERLKLFVIASVNNVYKPLLKQIKNDESFYNLEQSIKDDLDTVIRDITDATIDGVNSIYYAFDIYIKQVKIDIKDKSSDEDIWTSQLDLVTPDELFDKLVRRILINEFNYQYNLHILYPMDGVLKRVAIISAEINNLKDKMN